MPARLLRNIAVNVVHVVRNSLSIRTSEIPCAVGNGRHLRSSGLAFGLASLKDSLRALLVLPEGSMVGVAASRLNRRSVQRPGNGSTRARSHGGRGHSGQTGGRSSAISRSLFLRTLSRVPRGNASTA